MAGRGGLSATFGCFQSFDPLAPLASVPLAPTKQSTLFCQAFVPQSRTISSVALVKPIDDKRAYCDPIQLTDTFAPPPMLPSYTRSWRILEMSILSPGPQPTALYTFLDEDSALQGDG